jgi:uncharacterized protein
MIAVELSFTSAPERLASRPAHRALLDAMYADGRLHAAGPWADDSGVLLLFTVDASAVEAIMASDPYYSTAGVTVTSLREWNPVVGPGAAPGRADPFT